MYVLCAEDKKEDIRSKVWNYLDQNKLTQLFAPYKKISNFKVWLVECSLFLIMLSACRGLTERHFSN